MKIIEVKSREDIKTTVSAIPSESRDRAIAAFKTSKKMYSKIPYLTQEQLNGLQKLFYRYEGETKRIKPSTIFQKLKFALQATQYSTFYITKSYGYVKDVLNVTPLPWHKRLHKKIKQLIKQG